jgi:hypothetical protein
MMFLMAGRKRMMGFRGREVGMRRARERSRTYPVRRQERTWLD